MLTETIKKIVAGKMFYNMSWYGGAELVNLIFRFAPMIVLPRFFSQTEYGLMSIIYLSFTFAFVFIRSGITIKIVQSTQEELKTICDSSYWINWIVCISAFLLQCLLSYPVSKFYGNTDLFLPLCFSALTYLLFPLFLINSSLLEREGRFKDLAIIYAIQSSAASLLVVIFVILGIGIWAISISMFCSTLIWLIANKYETSWQVPKQITFKNWDKIVSFSKNVLGVELLNKLRGNIDYLIVGKLLGIHELGLYYFAFNAGSGITMNIVSTSISTLLSHLCNLRTEPEKFKKEYFKNAKIIMFLVSLVVILQTFLAPFYVPILFGSKWIPAVPILILICISVIPVSLRLIGSVLLNADGQPEYALRFDIIYTVIFTLCLLVSVQFGIYWVAVAVLFCHWVMGGLFAILSARKVFRPVS